jgi:hypothetical protein
MEWYYNEYGTHLAIPPEPETSNKWEIPITESHKDMEIIMREKPRGQRKVE